MKPGCCMLGRTAVLLLAGFFLPVILPAQKQHNRKNAPPISIDGLRQRSYEAVLKPESVLEETAACKTEVMSYVSDYLKVYTLVNTPLSEPPKQGYPVIIFGHGYHPNPPKYGINPETRENRRPGDYYRGLPEAYAEKGFLVLTPDYRGHNISEGYDYTQTSYLATSYYAMDVLNLIAALKTLKNADTKNVFYIGHSLGGDVGLKVLLADKSVRAASLWAPVVADTWEQAMYYGVYYDEKSEYIDSTKMKEYSGHIIRNINKLGYAYTAEEGDPINYISDISMPIIIHHAKDDPVVPFMWSVGLASRMYHFGKYFELYPYEGKDHLLQGDQRRQAMLRDVAFFTRYRK